LTVLGTGLVINGSQTINLAGCAHTDAFGNCVFDVTSYHENDGNMLTINGDGIHSGVVFDFSGGLNLGGDVTLTGGLTPDMIAWNFTGSGNVQLNNNASSFPSVAFQGIILAPNNPFPSSTSISTDEPSEGIARICKSSLVRESMSCPLLTSPRFLSRAHCGC
jgi:hypothetical protein